ncbi:hypothetical protein RB2501_13974 [Robiginitalea biformata HTCC2501]|uniref:Uncharacterized protein n=1 Tax=Robiginitalea biformata (strain ATCC BAA-864 / DSM 15991 / KCTC 12146 / HTCC2501) TaxID=313596 RepID=A4CKP2_ROBBH|nr:hypothetical protein RB2501_13974 [Robiginitalea biformata HTCC2501]
MSQFGLMPKEDATDRIFAIMASRFSLGSLS